MSDSRLAPRAGALRVAAAEAGRYVAASAAAFAVDFIVYAALIRMAGWHYLLAAPAAFALGLATIYLLSVRLVFRERRLSDARVEFAVFAAIGLLGMAVNQAMLYAGVEGLSLSYEGAKLLAATLVFCTNFALRKLLLFPRDRSADER